MQKRRNSFFISYSFFYHLLLIFLFFLSVAQAQNIKRPIPKVSEPESNLDELSPSIKRYVPKDSAKLINLTEAIEEGLRDNPQEKVRKLQKKLLDINWDNAYEIFWYPTIGLTMDINSHKLYHLKDSELGGRAETTTKTPQGSLGLSLGEYTLFNWGMDYLTYLNEKSTYKRGLENLSEDKRELKHQIIEGYFDLVRIRHIQKIARSHLRHLTFVLKVAKERARLKKIRNQEFFEVKSEYLRSYEEYHQRRTEDPPVQTSLANLLGDHLKTVYRTDEILVPQNIELTIEQAIKMAFRNNRTLRDNETNLKNNQRNYEKAIKESLPLPKITLQLGSYSYNYERDNSQTTYRTFKDSDDNRDSHVEIVATLNMRWNFIGEGGFFQKRKRQAAHLNMQIAELNYFNQKRQAEVNIRLLLQQIFHLESRIKSLEARLNHTQKTFDLTLENYLANKAKFHQLKDSMINLRDAEILYENIKFQHLRQKVELARTIGIEDLPGSRFENLAKGN